MTHISFIEMQLRYKSHLLTACAQLICGKRVLKASRRCFSARNVEVRTAIKRKRVHNSRRTLRTKTTSGNNENAGHRHTLWLGRRFFAGAHFTFYFFFLFISPFPTWSVALDSAAARLLQKRGRITKLAKKGTNSSCSEASSTEAATFSSTACTQLHEAKVSFFCPSLLFRSLLSSLAYQTQPPRSKQAMAWQVTSLPRLRCFVFFVPERPLLLAQQLQRRSRLRYRRVAKHQPHVSHLRSETLAQSRIHLDHGRL